MKKLNNKNFIGLVLALAFASFVPQIASAHPGFYVLSSEEATPVTNTCRTDRQNPAPVIYTTSPEIVNAGTSGMNVVIKGANLLPCSVAKWDGENRPTTYISPTRILMEVSTNDLAKTGKHLVTVMNPAPAGGLSNPLIMTVAGTQVGSGQSNNTNTSAISTEPATDIGTEDQSAGNVLGLNIKNKNSSATNLSASAAKSGSNPSFMPDTLLEWLILVVLIFIGIKLFRKLTKEPEAKTA